MIRILDLVFVTRDADGSMRALELRDIDVDGQFDLAVFEGASSGMLDDSDLADAASVIDPGSSAGILIFENRWATHVHRRRCGAAAPSSSPPATSRRRHRRVARRNRPLTEAFARKDPTMPGLLRGVARTAVVAGTATAVSNRVSRRQANRWSQQEDQQYAQQQQQYAQQRAAAPARRRRDPTPSRS